MIECEKGLELLSISGKDDSLKSEEGELVDAVLPVTQSDDPRSGGHLEVGASKTPPGSAREGSGIVVHIVLALNMAHSEHACVGEGSPISNGLTSVGGAKTRLMF